MRGYGPRVLAVRVRHSTDHTLFVLGVIGESMSILDTISEVLQASSQNPNRGKPGNEAAGAYWCHDCEERIPASDVEGESTPSCPTCGDEMEFERSVGSTGCAC